MTQRVASRLAVGRGTTLTWPRVCLSTCGRTERDGHQRAPLLSATPRRLAGGVVPKDNFYRRVEATLDLSFVRQLVWLMGGSLLVYATSSRLEDTPMLGELYVEQRQGRHPEADPARLRRFRS